MKKSNLVYINHILAYTKEALQFVENLSLEEFSLDRRNELAVIRCFEVIGEATKRIDEEFKNKYPDVEWKNMAGFRDVLIHDYDGLLVSIIFDTAKDRLPNLQQLQLKLLQNES